MLIVLVAGIATCLSSCASAPSGHSSDSAAARHYSHLMHGRFYEAWVQPQTVELPRGKISVPVDVRIDRDGRVQSFKIVRPSGNAKIDGSIAAIRQSVRQVAPPPLTERERVFDLRIFFELDVKR